VNDEAVPVMPEAAVAGATERNENRNGADLGGLRMRALELLCGGATASEVAREVGVDRSTVWRWTKDPVFAARFRATALERAQDAAARLDHSFIAAVDLLESVVTDVVQPTALRIRAAEALIRRSAPPERASQPGEDLPPAERINKLIESLSDPDPEVSEALKKTGWERKAS
jgi:hypothetical protein